MRLFVISCDKRARKGATVDEKMLCWSFVGVVLIGLTTIAYKHPAVYRRLSVGMIPILLCVVFASVGWNLGQSSAYQRLVPHISPELAGIFMTGFLDAVDVKYVYDIAMLLVIAYLFLLGYLVHILRSKEAPSAAVR